MAGQFEGLSDIEWKLFSNLFPVPGKKVKGENLQPIPNARSTGCCIFYSLVAAAVMYPALMSLQKCSSCWYQDGNHGLCSKLEF